MEFEKLRDLIDSSLGQLVTVRFIDAPRDEADQIMCFENVDLDSRAVTGYLIDPFTLERYCPPSWSNLTPPFYIQHTDFEAVRPFLVNRVSITQNLRSVMEETEWFSNVGREIEFGNYSQLGSWNDWRKVHSLSAKIEEASRCEQEIDVNQAAELAEVPNPDGIIAAAVDTALILDVETRQNVKRHVQLVCRIVIKSVRCGLEIPSLVRSDWEWLRVGRWPCGRYDDIY
jgi:hypothetical protein